MTSLLLATFLLAEIPSWLAYTGLFSLVVSILSVGFTIWFAFRKERREDSKEEQKEWKDLLEDVKFLKVKIQDHEGRFTAGQNQLEQAMMGVDTRFKTLEGQVSEVHQLSGNVATLQITVNNTEKKVDNLENRMETQFKELRHDVQAQTTLLNQILMGIADLGSLRKTK